MTTKNNTNDSAKRTANQINTILKANGIDAKANNCGDGRTFVVNIDANIKNLVAIKKAGFIRHSSQATDKTIYFNAF